MPRRPPRAPRPHAAPPGTAVLLLGVALACGPAGEGTADDGGGEGEASAGPAPTGSTCPTGSTLTYDSFGRAFFDDYCQRCHASTVLGAARFGAPSSATYDDVESIRAGAAEIDERAAAGPDAVNVDMPRGPPRPELDRRLQLGEWLACGAP